MCVCGGGRTRERKKEGGGREKEVHKRIGTIEKCLAIYFLFCVLSRFLSFFIIIINEGLFIACFLVCISSASPTISMLDARFHHEARGDDLEERKKLQPQFHFLSFHIFLLFSLPPPLLLLRLFFLFPVAMASLLRHPFIKFGVPTVVGRRKRKKSK